MSSVQAQDVKQIIAYGSGKTALKYIAFSALVLVVGLIVAFGTKNWLLGLPVAALAAVVLVWQTNGWLTAEPFLLLSPAGLRLNLDGYVFLDVPWREVEGISWLDITFEVVKRRWGTSWYRWGKDQYRDVTALQVSEAFMDETIMPLWRAVYRNSGGSKRFGIGLATFTFAPNLTASRLGNIFPAQDGKRFVALPHKVLSTNGEQLRAEVEARWLAFGKRTDTDAGASR
ncbi:hypothetical protein [Mesorhizobium huakuii]|uniref:DUF2982 domain-containing protein n=1 Tax=Mesorhizobium huakuii TaxID=28104 RepID=A0A7G6SP34_9HYPH|nr:hypothetical protein [Mesorhizobium huakuii]QND56266.1 hypothetical protein HB778_06185 [Mesorhizobium huakuii]